MITATAITLCLPCVAIPQLTTSEVAKISLHWIHRFSPGAKLGDDRSWAAVEASQASRPSAYTFVSGRCFVRLDGDGRLIGYTDGERHQVAPPEKFKDAIADSRAVSTVRSICEEIEAPADLSKAEVTRSDAPFAIMVFLTPKPNGYNTVGADSVECWLEPRSGEIKYLRVSRGWSYERPNIAVTRDQAIRTVHKLFSKNEEVWTCELMYCAILNPAAPEELRRLYSKRIARLCYVLMRPSDRQFVLVDSESGAVVDQGHYPSLKALGEPRTGGKVVYPDRDGRYVPASSRAASIRPVATGLALVALGVVLALWIRRRRLLAQTPRG